MLPRNRNLHISYADSRNKPNLNEFLHYFFLNIMKLPEMFDFVGNPKLEQTIKLLKF